MLLGAGTLTFLFVVAWRWPRLPGPLFAVLLATVLTACLRPAGQGRRRRRPAARRAPAARPAAAGRLRRAAAAGAGVLLVGYTDNVLTGRAFAIRGGYSVDANQEFLALGAANVGAGTVPGVPGQQQRQPDRDRGVRRRPHPAALARRGRLRRPRAAVPAPRRWRTSRSPRSARSSSTPRPAWSTSPGSAGSPGSAAASCVLAVVTLAGVLVFDILKGIVIAVIISGAEMLRRVARPHDAVQGRVAGLAGMHDIDDYPERTDPGPARVPLRRAAVLRERARLPPACPGRGRRTGRRTALVRAQRRGERRDRHHRPGRRRGVGRSSPGAASCSPSPGSSRTSWSRCGLRARRTDRRRRLFPTLPTAEAAYRAGRASRPVAGTAPRRQTPSRTRGLTHRPTTQTCPRAIAPGSCTTR